MRFRQPQIISLLLLCTTMRSVHINSLQDYCLQQLECSQLQVDTPAFFTVNFLDSGEVPNIVVELLTHLFRIRKFLGSDLKSVDQLSWQRVFVIFLSSSRQDVKLGHDCFLAHPTMNAKYFPWRERTIESYCLLSVLKYRHRVVWKLALRVVKVVNI
jgi:hypothetical protein